MFSFSPTSTFYPIAHGEFLQNKKKKREKQVNFIAFVYAYPTLISLAFSGQRFRIQLTNP